MDRRLLGGLVALLCCGSPLLGAAAPASASPLVGMGDQKADMFSDPRFLSLGIRHARLSVSWDALDIASQRRRLDAWMQAAHAAGVDALVSFDHSWRPGRHRMLPSARLFRREFARFHTRYPQVTDFATWNEANYCGEITCHQPARVAAYYRAMRSVCPQCRVLAAELLDLPNMVAWARQFEHYAHVQPEYWGLHNYIGANRLSARSTLRLLRGVRGRIWFTEIAGLVARHHGHVPRHVGFPESAAHAALVTRFIFEKLAPLSPRIERVYLYEWDARSSDAKWDSALIGVNGVARQAYWVLRQELARGFGSLGGPQPQPQSQPQPQPTGQPPAQPQPQQPSPSGGGGSTATGPPACQSVPIVGCVPAPA